MNINGSIASSNLAVSFADSTGSNSIKKKPRQRKSFKVKSNKLRLRLRSKSVKSASYFIYHKLNEGVASGSLNSLNKLQVSILSTKFINIEKEIDKVSAIFYYPPFNLSEQKFDRHISLFKKYPVLIKIEFCVASKVEVFSSRHALKEVNQSKNCNQKLVPYDYNRVVLEPLLDVPDSDYINATYVDSLLKPNAYIATQGPLEETISDFWRMIWEERSQIVVMLTKVFDFIRVMCCQYWPVEINKPEFYGPMEVTLLSEEALADFVIRTFRLRKYDPLIEKTKNVSLNDVNEDESQLNQSTDDEERIIYQFHYYNWPTHTCPYAHSLLQYRRRVRIYMNEVANESNIGPTIVHCSDGCGRTGTYMCIDANLEFADEDNMYDVFGYTKKMRQARKGMIETVDQYKFVYECLQEAYISGVTWFPVSELSQKMKYKSIKNPITKQNEYQREFQKVLKLSTHYSIGDCAGGHRSENRDKNRDIATVPPDNHRPYLITFQSNESTDYVNAVFVDGYTRSREYIVTEWPLHLTITDFWSLIYDHDCNSVIILANPEDSHTFPSFWPTEKEKRRKFGPIFTVDLVSFNHYTNIKTWIFRINKKVVSLTDLMSGVKGIPKTTQFFQITCWPQNHKVPTSTNALVELMNMVERWRQRTTYGPVCVVSTTGRSRAGVYIAANVAIEQVVQHGEVDVFQAVKNVRGHRPQLVENMTEYKYCYDLILHYVLNYLNKQ